MRVVRELPEAKWRRFVGEHPDGNIYHTPEMFDVYRRAHGYKPSLWAAVDAGGDPLAILTPVEVTLLPGLLGRFTARLICYGGPLCAPGDAGREALDALLAEYQRWARRRALFTEMRSVSCTAELRPALHAHGYAHEAHLNFLVDVEQPEDRLWAQMRPSCQRDVRKARRRGVVVQDSLDPQDLATAYDILAQVYRNARVPLASRTLFQAALDVLGPREMLRIFSVRVDDRCIGVRFALLHKDRVINWYGGTDRSSSSHCPGEAMMWGTMLWARTHGYRVLDFGGAGRPDESYGPRDFKAKFGGQLVDFGRDVCIHSQLAYRVSVRAYEATRKVLSLRDWARTQRRPGP